MMYFSVWPKQISSPSISGRFTFGASLLLLTNVPFMLPRSVTQTWSPSLSSRACRLDTRFELRTSSFSWARPTYILPAVILNVLLLLMLVRVIVFMMVAVWLYSTGYVLRRVAYVGADPFYRS